VKERGLITSKKKRKRKERKKTVKTRHSVDLISFMHVVGASAILNFSLVSTSNFSVSS
jgi:hypothetical protein